MIYLRAIAQHTVFVKVFHNSYDDSYTVKARAKKTGGTFTSNAKTLEDALEHMCFKLKDRGIIE